MTIAELTEDVISGMVKQIELIPKDAVITREDLMTKFPEQEIFACDFYVEGAERWIPKDYGFEFGWRIFNIDHHAPVSKMKEQVTSTTLAMNYVKGHGAVREDSKIVINHTDCDSMLGAMILSGYLNPEKRFAEASRIADYKGTENGIADLLQAVENRRDVQFSAEQLRNLVKGYKLDEKAVHDLEARHAERDEVRNLFDSGKIKVHGTKKAKIAYVTLGENVDAALFLPFLKDYVAVVVASPMDESKWRIKIRLGGRADGKVDLTTLGLPDFGGRWNAGGTGRHGGTEYTARQYVGILTQALNNSPSTRNVSF